MKSRRPVFSEPMLLRICLWTARQSVLLCALAMSAVAQQSTNGVVQERASATLVEIPVNVIGKNGKCLPGLTAADFELHDNGRQQEISGFQVVDLSRPAVRSSALSPADTPPPPAARRHWLLVFDLTYTSLTSLLRARSGAYSFVDTEMGPFDLAGVATLSIEQGWKLLENFTNDRVQLAHAIDTLGIAKHSPRLSDPLGFAFVPPGDEVAASDDADFQGLLRKANDMYERGRIATHVSNLGQMAQILDSVRGRKHVILFSEGFESRLIMGNAGKFATPMGQRDSTQDTAPENVVQGQVWRVDSDARFGSSATRQFLESAMSLFRRSDVILDTVDISGLRAGGDVSRRSSSGSDVLFTMANETNGDFIRNANELSTDLKQLVARTDLVYILAFQPRNLANPGSFHELRVKVKAPTSRVVCRSGYIEPRPYRSLTPMERMLASGDLMTSGGGPADLPVRVLTVPFAYDRKVAQQPVIIEIAGHGILEGDGSERRQLQIYAYANDANGTLTDYLTQEVTLDLSQVRGKLETGGVKFYGTLLLPPGRYTVRTLVRSMASDHSAVTASTVQVPAMPGRDPVVLPPFFFDQAPQASWIMVKSAPPRSNPSTIPLEYPFAVEGDSYLPAARPVGAVGTVQQVAVVTFNFGDSEHAEPLDVVAKVVGPDGRSRDAAVRVLRRSEKERNGARSLVLSLGTAGLERGRHVLQVRVSSATAKQSAQAESEFELR